MNNIFDLPEEVQRPGSQEHFEPLLAGGHGLLVERIVSYGHTTPDGTWYDQDRDEWVAVLEGEAVIAYADGTELFLAEGSHVFLPKHTRHRVARTSSPCIWLAIHGEKLQAR